MAVTTDFSDFARLEKSIKQLGKLPQKCVTKAAKKGAKPVLSEAKRLAPYRFGFLEEGIILVGERSKKKGKKVYQIVFDRDMTDIFRKEIKEPGKYGGKNPTAYYPASMEYGFKTKGGGERAGERFMLNAAENKAPEMSDITMNTLIDALDKEWAKR